MGTINEIIQQWQYRGRVLPEMLGDNVFEVARDSGVTSVQSYVLWSEIEKEEGKFDFTIYDELVERASQFGLRWTPFVIFGPKYATPEWFHSSEESVYAICLEHNKASKIQSIWNPNLESRAKIFYKKFAEHYVNAAIESILIGISGNWGESLFPINGGFEIFHTHLGWWCGDSFAAESFSDFLAQKYTSIEDAMKYFDIENRKVFSNGITPKSVYLYNSLLKHDKLFYQVIKKIRFALGKRLVRFAKFNESKKDLLMFDFIDWYINSMNKWCDLWISEMRSFFPDKHIYLVNGGNGVPQTGACFSAQTKIAASYGAGIRITNHDNTYLNSFMLTRLVATSTKLYNTYYSTEEAWINNEKGVLARIFDAATAGVSGFYSKNIIGTGKDHCSGVLFPAGELSEAGKVLKMYGHFMKAEYPNCDIALFCSNKTIYREMKVGNIFSIAHDLRQFIDIDLIDDCMIQDGILDRYNIIIIPEMAIISDNILDCIGKWAVNEEIIIFIGTVFIQNKKRLKRMMKEAVGIRYLHITRACKNFPFKIINFLENQKLAGKIFFDNVNDNIYTAIFDSYVLFLNESCNCVEKNIRFLKCSQENIHLEPHSITKIDLK